ncbi:MAG: NnrU family protein [Pseudohongiellaceae bacterium]
MTILVFGLVLFIGLHISRELGFRQIMLQRVGSESAYKGLYSVVALVGLGLIIWGKSLSPFIMLWSPRFDLRFISHFFMIPASILVLAGNLPVSYIRYHVRNPMLAGVALWGLAHLWSNGDLASILLFGSFTAWASFKCVMLGKQPRLADANRPYIFWDIIVVVMGLILYILISRYHGQLFGIGLGYV